MLFRDDLFPVQRKAIELADHQRGYAWFMEMGLGKTRTAFYEFHELAGKGMTNFMVVVCPRTLKGSWMAEAEEIGLPYPVLLWDTADSQMEKKLKKYASLPGPRVLAIHYDTILGRGGDALADIFKTRKVYLVLDESTRIKSPKSKVGKRLKLLSTTASHIRIMSGSPAPQGPHDLWNQYNVAGLMELPFFAFRGLYCRMGGYLGKQVVGPQNMQHLRDRVAPYTFRARKDEWTDLPEKLWAIRDVEMLPEQREWYLRMLHDMVVSFGDQEITAEMAVTAKTKLQQISSGFIYDENRKPIDLVDPDKNPKLNSLMEYIEDVETKIIVPYHFGHSFKLITERLEKAGIMAVHLPSKLDDDTIEARKRVFNNDDDAKACVLQSASYQFGHTLLGTKNMPCHNTGFFENTYSLLVRQQVEDRNHRHGQLWPVLYTDFAISREERTIIKALQKKDGLQKALLGEFERYALNPDRIRPSVGNDQSYGYDPIAGADRF